MSGIRKALLFTSAERYTGLAVNFLLIAVMSRLLSPAEIGVAAFGALIWTFIEFIRDVPSSYLVQQHELERADTRTAFTVMLLITLAASGTLAGGAHEIAARYNDPRLASYLQVLAVALLAGPFERPLVALFRREMAFDRLAIVSVIATVVNASTTIGLGLAGYGYMSFAWGITAGSLTSLAMIVTLRPYFWAFVPSLVHWRRAVRYGGVTGVCTLMAQASDMIPYFILNHFYKFDAVGYYNRANQVSQAPSKMLLAGLSPVILPALSKRSREGGGIHDSFLMGISHLSAVYWPAFLLLALLAHPAVAILVGAQWMSTVPLVQFIAIAMLFGFAQILIYPTLMAAGALRHLLMWHVIAMPLSTLIGGMAAMYGLQPLVLSLLIIIPLQNAVGLSYCRIHAGFSWAEFWRACRGGIVVALGTNAPAALYIAVNGFSFAMSIPMGIALGFAAIASWLATIWVTRHPLRGEIVMAASAVRRRLRPSNA